MGRLRLGGGLSREPVWKGHPQAFRDLLQSECTPTSLAWKMASHKIWNGVREEQLCSGNQETWVQGCVEGGQSQQSLHLESASTFRRGTAPLPLPTPLNLTPDPTVSVPAPGAQPVQLSLPIGWCMVSAR